MLESAHSLEADPGGMCFASELIFGGVIFPTAWLHTRRPSSCRRDRMSRAADGVAADDRRGAARRVARAAASRAIRPGGVPFSRLPAPAYAHWKNDASQNLIRWTIHETGLGGATGRTTGAAGVVLATCVGGTG